MAKFKPTGNELTIFHNDPKDKSKSFAIFHEHNLRSIKENNKNLTVMCRGRNITRIYIQRAYIHTFFLLSDGIMRQIFPHLNPHFKIKLYE